LRKLLLKVVIGISIAGIGVYAIYNYSLNLIGNKISDHLVAEAASNPQWLEKIDSSGLSAPSGQADQHDSKITEADISAKDKQDSKNISSKPNHEEQAAAPTKAPVASEPQEADSATDKKSTENKGLAFESKQEAIKFVMGRFSASEINHIRGRWPVVN
jgi:hypothetical protein